MTATAGRPRDGFEGYDETATSAAIERRRPGGWLAISGRDAVSFLQGVLTNDIASLSPGHHCYAAYLTAQGRMVSDMEVLRRDDDVLLAVEPAVASGLAERFDRSIFTEDVRIEDRSGVTVTFGVHGPEAHAGIARVMDGAPGDAVRAALRDGRHVTIPFDDGEVVVYGTTSLGVPGARVAGPAARLEPLRGELETRYPVLGPEAFAARRIEAGTPVFGIDMTAETIPLEAGIEARAISITKGCYVGQEIVVRILHRAHGRVARRLVGVAIESDTVPDLGAIVRAGEREAGRITSAAWSPAIGGPLALAMVHREFLEGAAGLAVDGKPARLVALPIGTHAEAARP
jgi:folate-binding protein YgfZ